MSVSLNDFNIDLLANILSYIDVSDIRNCWIVNKKFALIISTKLHFWKRQSDYAMKRFAKKHSIIHLSHLFHLFDPFFIKGESLKSQMGWIFDSRYFNMCDYHNLFFIYKRHDNSKWSRFKIYIESKTLFVVSVYTSKYSIIMNGLVKSYYPEGGDVVFQELLNGKTVRANGYVPSQCAFWNGEVYPKGSQYIPHGKGKWTFDDGGISEGAVDGKPIIK